MHLHMSMMIGVAMTGAAMIGATMIAGIAAAAPVQAASIIEEWDSVKAPPAPVLKAVTVEPKTTALLMLDFMNQNCGKRPRCVESLPAMKTLLDAARAAKAQVVYSFIANTTAADVMKEVAPIEGEPSVTSGPNKFLRTDLDKILKDKGIQTVIVVGTAANGAVLQTASQAALTGLNVIIPVDGISGDLYAEQYTVWNMVNAPGVSAKSTLTKSGMIRF